MLKGLEGLWWFIFLPSFYCQYPIVILLLFFWYPSAILLLSIFYPSAILLRSFCYSSAILLRSFLLFFSAPSSVFLSIGSFWHSSAILLLLFCQPPPIICYPSAILLLSLSYPSAIFDIYDILLHMSCQCFSWYVKYSENRTPPDIPPSAGLSSIFKSIKPRQINLHTYQFSYLGYS